MPEIIKSLQKGVAAATVIMIAVCLVISAVQLFVDISDDLLSIVSVAVLATVSYASAYISTQLYRSKGLLQGVLCGSVVFALVLSASIITHNFRFTDLTVIKGTVCIIAGAVGGVKGINTKKTNLKRFWH